MGLNAVVLLFFATVEMVTSEFTFDTCVVGNEKLLNSSMTSFCPLLPRAGTHHESSCSLILDANGIKNQDCTHCHWRERNESLCYPSTDNTRQHCCCRAPNCNKKIIEDSILGWGTEQVSNTSCLSANLVSKSGDLQWSHNPSENCSQAEHSWTMCYIKVAYTLGNVNAIETGCLNDTEWKEVKSEANFTSCDEQAYHWNPTLGIGVCCGGGRCISKLYRESIFRELQRTRQIAEISYVKLVEHETTKKSEPIWAIQEGYLSAQIIFEVLMVLFTSTYLSGMYYIYVTYKPTNMEKRLVFRTSLIKYGLLIGHRKAKNEQN